MNTPNKVITHHAVSSKAHTAEDVDNWHKVRWPGFTSSIFRNAKGEFYHVGYHYVIEWDGRVVQTRGEGEEGAHTVGQNDSSIGVCFMGNFDLHMPSELQKEAFKKLYAGILERHRITTCVPHRKYANKSCHGALLSDTYFSDLVSEASITQLQSMLGRLKKLLALTKKKNGKAIKEV